MAQEPEPPPGTLSRRRFVQGATGAIAATGSAAAGLSWPQGAGAAPRARRAHDALPVPPEPIPGGIQIPDGPLIHVWVPGPEGAVLPFTKTELQGFDADPSVLTDFRGFTAQAYLLGKATGSDGAEYDLEVDVRGYRGTYVDGTGTRRFGTFAFI